MSNRHLLTVGSIARSIRSSRSCILPAAKLARTRVRFLVTNHKAQTLTGGRCILRLSDLIVLIKVFK
ncbi:MAG: hypothetical protein SWY16_21740 [Cyanobacteriota bacterium]|nr:hypothetical protein [Cyanobacteriota bacterium]